MIYINLCVDWEGDHFRNLRELNHLRAKIGDYVPFTHFICPTYFYRYPKHAVSNIQSAIQANDEVGLHIHANKSLIKNTAGVAFKTAPNYYKTTDPLICLRNRLFKLFPTHLKNVLEKHLVSGRGVPLSAYDKNEIRAIIQHSKQVLEQKMQLAPIQSFRAGGWIANDDVLELLPELGFGVDSSAVPPEIVSNGYDTDFNGNNHDDFNEHYPVFTEFIKQLWGNSKQDAGLLKNQLIHQSMPGTHITKTQQPFRINQLIEIPNNCGASDFASMDRTFLPVLHKLIKENEQHTNTKPLFMNLTCHQEGDYYYKKGILDFYRYIEQQQYTHIQFTTVEKSARIIGEYTNTTTTS